MGFVVLLAVGAGAAAHGATGTLADGNGQVVGWGFNGNGETTVPSGAYSAIAAGDYHVLAIRSDGTLASWGFNSAGVLTVPSGTFTAIAAGDQHSLAIRSGGTLAGWGANGSGQTTVPSGTFTAIDAGTFYSLGIQSDGTLAGWGRNDVGQTTVPSGTFSAVAAGYYHGIGIRTDGTLAGWGRNDFGQATVPSGTFTAVAGGNNYSLGIKSDGTLAGWGFNFSGQTSVPSGTFTVIAAGAAHGLAIRRDGTLAGWGYNVSGQTTVPSGTFVSVAAGPEYSLALPARTDYDGDLLVSGNGLSITANLNRSINVAGNARIETTMTNFNNPVMDVAGKLILAPGAGINGNGTIYANGLELLTNFSLPSSLVANTGPLTGTGNLAMAGGAQLNVGLTPAAVYSGLLTIPTLSAVTFSDSGFQSMGALIISNGGELRMGPAQRVQFTNSSINAGKIELLGTAANGASEIEFMSAITNTASSSLITGQNATMRFDIGLTNDGSLLFTSGLNNVSGDVSNSAGGKIMVAGGAATTFYDDVVQNGTLQVIKVGSTNSTAIFAGAFTGSGGSSGGGDIFFLGDLRPGNSPASVTLANNVAFGSSATLNVEIGGTTQGAGYDHINVAGQLALDGILDIDLIGGFNPQAGNSFNILDWTSLSGTFSAIQLPTLAGGLAWNTSQLYTTGMLSVTAAGIPGDYNNDGSVDAADYVRWRMNTANNALPNDNGLTTQADRFNLWRSNFGNMAGSGSGATGGAPSGSSAPPVPEPAAAFSMLLGIVATLTVFPRQIGQRQFAPSQLRRRV